MSRFLRTLAPALAALLAATLLGPGQAQGPAARPDTSRLKPLIDMGPDDRYQGLQGGLYPGGRTDRPPAHEKAGLEVAKQVRPLDARGKPAEGGKIVLLSVGFSNTVQCFNGFIDAAAADKDVNPRVVLVNGAQGGRSAFMIQSPDDNRVGREYWRTWVPDHLKAAGVTPAQVQVVWLKETDARLGPGQLRALGVEKYDCPLDQPFPKNARTLQAELRRIVGALPRLFPNVKLVYLSSRSYGAYARRPANPEPFSYETGFAVKWLIEDQIKGAADLNFDPGRGAVRAPWLSWGPYLWANGARKRQDGFQSLPADYRENEGLHHSPQGMKKMGRLLLQFFKTDPTTKGWFCTR
jgi:hypothetical protein